LVRDSETREVVDGLFGRTSSRPAFVERSFVLENLRGSGLGNLVIAA
jgi:hypothetical protein